MGEQMRQVLLGMAVGDSIGLPYEGLKASKIARRLEGQPLRQCLWFGKGWISDDTETAILTLAALRMPGPPERGMALLLRKWFWTIPPGIGLATVRSCLKMTFNGANPKSGVMSAGNGALMRALICGVWAAERNVDPAELAERMARPTHAHPLALDGCRALAVNAFHAAGGIEPKSALAAAIQQIETDDMQDRLHRALAFDLTRLGLPENPPGFVGFSLPLAVAAWMRHPTDMKAAISEVVLLGGDTDSHAALVGGLCAISGAELPSDWIENIGDRPISPSWIASFAENDKATSIPWFALRLRNLKLLAIVLAHGFLRLVK